MTAKKFKSISGCRIWDVEYNPIKLLLSMMRLDRENYDETLTQKLKLKHARPTWISRARSVWHGMGCVVWCANVTPKCS